MPTLGFIKYTLVYAHQIQKTDEIVKGMIIKVLVCVLFLPFRAQCTYGLHSLTTPAHV